MQIIKLSLITILICFFWILPVSANSWTGREDSRPELQLDERKAYVMKEPDLFPESGRACLALDHVGRYLAMTKYNDRLMVWDLETGQSWIMSWGGEGSSDIAFSADNQYIYHIAWDPKIWDFRHEREIEQPCIDWDHVDALLTSQDSSYLVGSDMITTLYISHLSEDFCQERRLIYENLEGSRYLMPIAAHSGRSLLAVSRMEVRQAKGGTQTTVDMWDLRGGRLLRSLSGYDVISSVFSPDGKQLVGADSDGTIQIWDVDTGNLLAGWQAHAPNTVVQLALDPSGRWLASGGVKSSEEEDVIKTKEVAIKIWRLDQLPAQGNPEPVFVLADETAMLQFDPRGRFLASYDYDKGIQLWDYRRGKLLLTIQALPLERQWVVTTPDGRFDFSPETEAFLYWRWQGKRWHLSRFQQQYHEPGLLARVLRQLEP